MTPEELAAKQAADAAANGEGKPKDGEPDPKPLSPIDKELEKANKDKGRTELEKAMYKRGQIDKRIVELGGVLPKEDDPEDGISDDEPVTVGLLKKIEADKATKTSLTFAEERITDSKEQDLVKHYLQTRIIPSGDPEEDFNMAVALVNRVKNGQILEEQDRRPQAPRRGNGTGAPAKREEPFEPTLHEAAMMKPPFSLSKEEILASRPKQ